MKSKIGWTIFLIALVLFAVGYSVKIKNTAPLKLRQISDIGLCKYGNAFARCFRAMRGLNTNYYVLLDKYDEPVSVVLTDGNGKVIEETWNIADDEDEDDKSVPNIVSI